MTFASATSSTLRSKPSDSRGRSRADLDIDDMLTLALTKLVEIVGEAAK